MKNRQDLEIRINRCISSVREGEEEKLTQTREWHKSKASACSKNEGPQSTQAIPMYKLGLKFGGEADMTYRN